MTTPVHETSPDLDFEVAGVAAAEFAALPTLVFRIAISRTGGGPVRSVMLATSIRIAAGRRRYDSVSPSAMSELFATPREWSRTLRPLPWTRTSTVVPPFDEHTVVELEVPCSTDAELALTKYFHAVRDGDVPLDLLFSGTVFHSAPGGGLRTAQISWSKDTSCELPARLWHDLVTRYHGDHSWLRLSREAHDRLSAYRAEQVLCGWDETVHSLLDRTETGTGAATGAGAGPETAGARWTP